MFVLSQITYKEILTISDLTLPDGAISCIVGPSGSGKTTLLRLLNRLISPDSGSVTFLGQDLATLDPVQLRRKVVMLQQTPVIFPGTVKENLLLGCSFAELPAPNEQELLYLLHRVGLKKSFADDAELLSGGERQRLALARVMLMHPPVLLLDEPSSALDEDTEKVIFDVLSCYIREENRAMVMVTHSKSIAYSYADDVVTITAGQVENQEVLKH